MLCLRQGVNDFFFDVTKLGFTFTLEELPNGAPQTLFDRVVRIYKTEFEAPSELAPYCRLSRAWKAHQTEKQLKRRSAKAATPTFQSPGQTAFSE